MSEARLRLWLEIVDERALVLVALPALEAGRERGESEPLERAAREALPKLRASVRDDEDASRRLLGGASTEELAAGKLALGRLEAVIATAPEPVRGEAALEEVAWALVRAARLAKPVSIGEDWDLLRALIDPARRRTRGIAARASTLAGAAIMGEAPLESAKGFGLARARSCSTGWNGPARVKRIARALARFAPGRLESAAQKLTREMIATIYPVRRTPLARRLERAHVALEKLRAAYELASKLDAGVFVEVEIN